ncbi:outer membrane protein [Pelagibacterium lacus]|uniref:Porin family protein n=1 Tax=Pelagibacterium lacus TaxID=2282655 RepID=A0A369W4F6_9HYPH|nr:porin family protein [Pelagibacterium lacus]RDE09203.1 porin family protein [Pelagibacterium lacus]
MKTLKTLALAAAVSTAAAGGALAADAIGVPAPIIPPAPVVDMGSGFDWNGFYAGISGGVQNETVPGDTSWALGAQAGVNSQFDFFLVGAEVSIEGVFDDPDTYAYGSALARGGVLVTDELLAYGAIGYGTDFDAATGPGDHVLAGGGLEFAATDDVSVRGQYLYGWEQSGAAGASDVHKFTIGANFHF